MQFLSLDELNDETATIWLKSPAPMEEEPFGQGQDWSLVFPGALTGGIIGHLRFYLHEQIPNPEKRRFLLNAIHVLAGRELEYIHPKRGKDGESPADADFRIELLLAAAEFAEDTSRTDLHRWAAAVRSVLQKKKRPRSGFWFGWGWSWQAALIYVWWP
jgi:hypothetical protein